VRGRPRALAATLVALCALARPAGSRAESFFGVLGRRPILRPIAVALRDTVARSVPVAAASPGVNFTFNPETGAFERETTVLGQLFLERAATLGRGKWNFSVGYEWVPLDTVDGRDLDSLSDTGSFIVDPNGGGFFTIPHFALDLATNQVTLMATYGVTDDLDLNLTLPLLQSAFTVRALLRQPSAGRTQLDHAHASAFGVGDLLLRAKYRVVHDPLGDLAAGLVLRVPTGNEDNFQGTGVWEVSPALYGSTRAFAVGETVWVQAYANAAVDLDAADVGASEARFGLGLDCAVGRRFTGAIAFLAREPFTGIAPPGFFDVQRVDPKTGLPFRAPILGFDRGRPSYYDLSLGGRVMLWRDTLIGFVNVLLPLNDDGFRSDVIPLAGIEAVF